uniref:Tetratricopeptide repeat protein 39C n=1 Tax=Photinus pyralis TaxID=7054 RepID=A0A1Y1LC40_PHOPY
MATFNRSPNDIPKWKLAREGIQLLINNKASDAEALFKEYPDSIHLYAGYSFAIFMDAITTLEDDKLTTALSALKETERRCYSDNGWMKVMKSKVFGAETSLSDTEYLEHQIILADAQVCMAILIFLQQDVSGMFKGGWILRKSWKIYQHTYNTIRSLYKEIVGELPDAAIQNIAPLNERDEEEDVENVEKQWEYLYQGAPPQSPPSNGKPCDIDKETITRLMGAISFGYGLFHLGVSLLPPSLLRVTSFLGFGGNRNLGISNLMYSREGSDMHAPLATLALLWYHTIVRPFYALDGSNVRAGVEAAMQLLDESQKEYRDSALFLFFLGRIHRLNSNIPEALNAFQASVENSIQREIKMLSLHEVGWCYLIQLDYRSAELTFEKLRVASRWSREFYTYLSIICAGACNSIKNVNTLSQMKTVYENSPKLNQLGMFLSKRFALCPTADKTKLNDRTFWIFLIYDILYLWNALPSCTFDNIRRIISDCENVTVEPMLGLALLIRGTCHCILKEYEVGIECLRQCLEIRKELPHNADDAHVSAFAQYELGHILMKKLGKKKEGKAMLADVERYKDYDFEQRLNVRVHSLIKLS